MSETHGDPLRDDDMTTMGGGSITGPDADTTDADAEGTDSDSDSSDADSDTGDDSDSSDA